MDSGLAAARRPGMTAEWYAYEKTSHFAQSRHRRRAQRGAWLCRVLDRDDPGDGVRIHAAAAHAESRQRQNHVQHWRLRVVPRRPRQGSEKSRSHAARWRLGFEIADRAVLRAP